jgi:hypothetical protein
MACNANYLMDEIHVEVVAKMGGQLVVLFLFPTFERPQPLFGQLHIINTHEPTNETMPQTIVIKQPM